MARSDTVYNLKLGHFINAQHIFAQYLQHWVDELKQRSDGRLNITIFPANEMGPVQNYVDYARTGVADITWYLTGATPGRFPLTEIIQLPYMVGSAEIGIKTLNDPEVLKLLEPEYEGLKILYLLTTQPGNLLTSTKPVRTVEDMKGLRIRFASVTIKSFIAALGGTPVGVPPSGIADAMQKNTIDGCFLDYGGADTAFHLGGIVKYSTEMYSYVSSFGVVMNPASYAKLPPDLQKLIDDTTRPRVDEIGKLWDSADAPGKKYLWPKAIRRSNCPRIKTRCSRRSAPRTPRECLPSSTRRACRRPRCTPRCKRAADKYRQDLVLVLENVNGAGNACVFDG